jgi:hypothetical protein
MATYPTSMEKPKKKGTKKKGKETKKPSGKFILQPSK